MIGRRRPRLVNMQSNVTLAITLGDPGGIGPEIALKAAYAPHWPRGLRLVLIGHRRFLRHLAGRLQLPVPPVWDRRAKPTSASRVVVWEPEPYSPEMRSDALWRPGITGRRQGRVSALWIRSAVAGCLAGWFDGMVTGPVCKQSLHLAGLPFPGHTEYLADLTRTRRYAMLLMGGPLRVVLATRHIPLARVAAAITRNLVMDAVKLAAQAVDWLELTPRTIGVCALNPHAGDQGLLGREELATLIPAIRALRRQGLAVEGPVPADVIFYQAMQHRFGAVVAMYHDQGLAPLKTIAFETGVNLTLGLPITRTSPDHGTAFDIAGRGTANPASMAAAIRLAARLALRPNPWKRD